MTVAHLDCFSGASGDMFLGALVGAGVSVDALTAVLKALDVKGWALSASEVVRGGLAATSVAVKVGEVAARRTWADVRALLGAAALPPEVYERSLAVFERLAVAEGRVHRMSPDDLVFHEIGGVDAIVDIVGTCAGLEVLGVDHLTSSPVAVGGGTVATAHGLLPAPGPAVVELLRGAPTYGGPVAIELCTPTGAALLAELVDEWGPQPAMRVSAVGYGAGTNELEHPNVLRLTVGEPLDAPAVGDAVVLETTIDDLPGELVPPVLDALRAAGASDAWARPVVMKKGRPGLEIACIGPVSASEAMRRVLFTETTTLGVRGRVVDKWTLDRDWVTVEVAGVPVRLKVGRLGGAVVNVAPEFEDCRAVAKATGLPLKEVFARARAAYPG